MNTLNLHLPDPELTDAAALDPAPPQLDGWLETLRTGNFEDAAERVRDVLHAYNRSTLDAAVRLAALELLRPVVRELIASLEDRFLGGTFPLRDRQRAKALNVASLLEECAIGYKHVLVAALSGQSSRLTTADVLHAAYHAVRFLADRLLAAYLIYAPEPPRVWGEIHRIFAWAEKSSQHGLHADRNARRSENTELYTINHAYKRIVLLYLANPYHLMGREAATVYNELDQWAHNARVLSADRVQSVEGRFYIDLAGEDPPQFALQGKAIQATATTRVFDISRLVAGINMQIKKYTDPVEGEKRAGAGFRERIFRDMLQRIERAWGGRRERKNEREPSKGKIIMAVGLTTSHHFISNEAPFIPERDEVRFHRPDGIKSALTLMPVDHEPWKIKDSIDKLDTGVTTVRTSQFDGAEDLWEKIYATKARANAKMDDVEPEFTAQLWDQFNNSNGGLGVECDGRGKRVRVGDIVVMKQANNINAEWQAAIVRWLRDQENDRLGIGLMLMTGAVYAVAVRSIGGVGSGGEYFRSLLLRNGSTKTLLLPCSIYDIGTCLVVNTGRMLSYAKLTNVRETTTTFAHFDYEQIEAPTSEMKNIEAIKAA